MAFRVFVTFMGHWDGVLGLDVCGFHSICSVYKAFGLVLLVVFRVLVVFMGD